LDASVHHDDHADAERDAALERADRLLATAASQLQEQDAHLESLYALVDYLLQVGPPMTVVEGQIVRAWSPALESLTGIRATTAVGAVVDGLIPSFHALAPGPCHWTDRVGNHWAIDVHQTGPRLRVLRWTAHRDSPDGPVAVSA
jgi:hypothetical protein